MDKKHNSKNNLIQRIKQINKNNNIDYTEFLIKYCPRNIQKEHNIITCVEREINIINQLPQKTITEEEKVKLCKSMKDKYKKEMKIISKFSHPNIIKIIDSFEYPENIIHIISENYQCDLDEFIKMQINKKRYFSESIILSFFTQICLGIKYIHDLNILHRNINPSNILLISNKIVKLSNFDLLRVLYTSNEKSITLINNVWNSYISPEMGMNIPYSFKNDIWSMGILLFHMMALKVPFNLNQLKDIQNKKKVESMTIYNKIPKHFSNDIKMLCIDLLKAYPAERPDINSILTKYKIIKNEVEQIKKMLGNNIVSNIQNNNIKNMNRTDLKYKIDEKNKNKNINKINFRNRFKSFSNNSIKIGTEKNNNNINNNIKSNNKIDASIKKEEKDKKEKENENLKISIYENIKEKVNDPNNIMEPNYITGEIINIPENSESLDLRLFKNTSNSNKRTNSYNRVSNDKEIKEK